MDVALSVSETSKLQMTGTLIECCETVSVSSSARVPPPSGEF